MVVECGKNDLLAFHFDDELYFAGYNGTASFNGKMWSLNTIDGTVLRETRSERVAINHCKYDGQK